MAVLQDKQSGSVALAYNEDYAEATVSSYTLAQSILLFTYRGGKNEVRFGAFRGWKVDTTTLRFERNGADANGLAATIEWQLLEFDTDVDVQEVQRTDNGTVTITAITTANTFMVPGGFENGGAIWGGDDYVRVYLSDTTTVQFTSEGAAGSSVRNAQVVEFTGCTVQHFSKNYSGTGTSTTQTITSVTQANTGLFCSMSTGRDKFDGALWRMRLTSNTVVTFDRTTGDNDVFDWELYVAEFTDGTSLQQGTHIVADADGQEDITITAVTIAESAVNLGGSGPNYGTHGTGNVDDDDTSDCYFTAKFQSTTVVRIDRDATSGAVGEAYQVWEWNVSTPPPPPSGVTRSLRRRKTRWKPRITKRNIRS